MATHNVPDNKPVRVALWCVPRSMSTILAKCLCGIDDITVFSELYTYADVCRDRFAKATGRSLPAELDGNESIYQEANAICEKLFRHPIPTEKMSYERIKERLTRTSSQYVFVKEMAYPVESFRAYLPDGLKHTFIIRDPSRCYTSFRRSLMATYGDTVSPDYDVVRDDVTGTKPMTWFESQHKFWRYVVENLDPNPVIIDAYDLLSRPGPTLRAYCEAVGFPYSDDLLQWEASLELPGNMETLSPQVYANVLAFYGTALNSTHFMAPQESGPVPRDQLSDDVIRSVDFSAPFYREMYENRLKI